MKVTAVLLNYARPENMPEQIEALKREPDVEKILLLNGRPSTKLDIDGVECLEDFDMNEKYGSGRRWLVDLDKVPSDVILFMDDDKVLAPGNLQQLQRELQEGKKMAGYVGRTCDANGYDRFLKKNNSVLTPILMVEKQAVSEYQKAFHKYAGTLEKRHGNGEDLAFNHFFRNHYKMRPSQVKFKNAPKKLQERESYSGKRGHMSQRNAYCKELKELSTAYDTTEPLNTTGIAVISVLSFLLLVLLIVMFKNARRGVNFIR